MKAAQENYVNSSNLRFESFEERMLRTEKRNAELEAIAKSSMGALAAVNAELALLREQIARRNQAGADSALLSFFSQLFFHISEDFLQRRPLLPCRPRTPRSRSPPSPPPLPPRLL